MPTKTTYWVRSKQTNEIGGFGRRPVPAQFETLEDARDYRRELNLRRGAFHPGYFVEVVAGFNPRFHNVAVAALKVQK